MTRAHRLVHRWAWLGLAVLLPLALILGLVIRQDPPIEETRFPPPGSEAVPTEDGRP